MNQNFSKFQNYVEDKLTKLEVEQTDLKSKVLSLEKTKHADRSLSLISPALSNRQTIDSRIQDVISEA